MPSIERRLEELEAVLVERSKAPAYDPQYVTSFMLNGEKGDNEIGKKVGDGGLNPASASDFRNHSRLSRWQQKFLLAFGPAVFEDGFWHWPEYCGNQQRHDYNSLP